MRMKTVVRPVKTNSLTKRSFKCVKRSSRWVWVEADRPKNPTVAPTPSATLVEDWNGYIQPQLRFDTILGCKRQSNGRYLIATRYLIYGGNAMVQVQVLKDVGKWLNSDWSRAFGESIFTLVDGMHTAYRYVLHDSGEPVTYYLAMASAEGVSVPFNVRELIAAKMQPKPRFWTDSSWQNDFTSVRCPGL